MPYKPKSKKSRTDSAGEAVQVSPAKNSPLEHVRRFVPGKGEVLEVPDGYEPVFEVSDAGISVNTNVARSVSDEEVVPVSKKVRPKVYNVVEVETSHKHVKESPVLTILDEPPPAESKPFKPPPLVFDDNGKATVESLIAQLEPKSHCGKGGSNERWYACAGSVQLCKQLGLKSVAGLAADLGTLAHDLGELHIKDWIAWKEDGSSPSKETVRKMELYPEKVNHWAKKYADLVVQHVFQKRITGKAYGIEEKVMLSTEHDAGGWIDVWVIEINDKAKRVMHIGDCKTGAREHEPDSFQFKFYAAAFLSELREMGKDVDEVHVHVFQVQDEDKPHRTKKLSVKELEKFTKSALERAAEADAPNPTFTAGEHCIYCPAQARCETHSKYRFKKFAPFLSDPEESQVPTAIKTVPLDVALNVYLKEKEIQNFLKVCKATLIQSYLKGAKLPGKKKVVKGTGRAMWSKNTKALKSLLKKRKIEGAVIEQLIARSEVISLLTEKYGEEKALEIVQPFTSYSKANPVIVDVTDKRPAIKNAAEFLMNFDEEEENDDIEF